MSASIRPADGMPAWRIAVIGAVGILAVGIGIAAGSFLLNTRSAAVGAGAAYVPADAPFYVEMRLEPSAEQDAALRELLGRFPPIEGVDLDQPLYTQMVERIDEMLAAEGRRRQLGRGRRALVRRSRRGRGDRCARVGDADARSIRWRCRRSRRRSSCSV